MEDRGIVVSDLTPIALFINASYNSSSTELNQTDDYDYESGSNATVVVKTYSEFFLFNLKALKWLNFYYLGAIMIVGVLGNGFNFVSFLQTRRKLSSPNYYLATLALADAVFLLAILIVWIGHFKIKVFLWPRIYNTLVYLSSLSSCLSPWLVAAFTFERLIVVRYPLKRHQICTVRRAKVIICCLTVVVAIIQILSLFTSELEEKTNQRVEKEGSNRTSKNYGTSDNNAAINNDDGLPDYHRSQVMRVITMLETVVTLVIPPVLIVIMNGLIIQGLFEFYRTFSMGENRHQGSLLSSARQTEHAANNGENIQMRTMTFLNVHPSDRVAANNSAQSDNLLNNENSISSSSHVHKYTNTLAIVEQQPTEVDPSAAPIEIQSHSSSVRNECSIDLVNSNMDCSSAHAIQSVVGDDDESSSYSQIVGREKEDITRNLQMETRYNNNAYTEPESHFMDLDAIELDCLQPHPSVAAVEGLPNKVENASPAHVEHPSPQPHHHPHSQTADNNVESSRASTTGTHNEYTITKKLVIVSTLHILLNLPSYAVGLKIFIDETITPGAEIGHVTWICQQYSMLLYYTNFAINFLLYSSSSVTYSYQFVCWCKKRSQNQTMAV